MNFDTKIGKLDFSVANTILSREGLRAIVTLFDGEKIVYRTNLLLPSSLSRKRFAKSCDGFSEEDIDNALVQLEKETLERIDKEPAEEEKKEEKPKIRYETVLTLPDGRHAEQIHRKGNECFIVYDPKTKKTEYRDTFEIDGEIIMPLPLDENILTSLTLSGGVEEYGSLEELRKEMLDFALSEYDPVSNTDLFKLIINLFLITWIGPEWSKGMGERFIPIVAARGPSETGKKRVLTIARYLTYRPIYMLKTTKVPSMFRAVDPWKGTLILDEADCDDSTLSSEFIQFLNSRADGVSIPRFSIDTRKVEWFSSFGMSILATRRPFADDGLESRAIVMPTESTDSPEKYDLVPSRAWVKKGLVLQKKLLLFRLHNLTGKIPTQLLLKDVNSFRVRESLLVLQALSKEDPTIVDDLATIGKKMEQRIIEERAQSPEGLILNFVYSILDDDKVDLLLWRTSFQIIRRWSGRNSDGEEKEYPVLLKTIAGGLGDAFSSSEIARFWRGLGQNLRTQGRVVGRKCRGIILITNKKRLQKEFKKYVPNYKPLDILEKIQQKELGGFEDKDSEKGGTDGTDGTNTKKTPKSVPQDPLVPSPIISKHSIMTHTQQGDQKNKEKDDLYIYDRDKQAYIDKDGTSGASGTPSKNKKPEKPQRDKLLIILKIIWDISTDSRPAHIEDIRERGNIKGMSNEEVDQCVKRLFEDAHIFSTKKDYYFGVNKISEF